MKQGKYDIVVVGSGIGGMCAAALLSNKGYKTLVVEMLPSIGGRCSTLEYKGFKVTTGLLGFAMAGILREIFEEVGAQYELRPIPITGRYLIDGKEFQVPEKAGFRALLSHVCKDETEVNRIRSAMKRADTWEEPSNEISLRDWLVQYTTNEKVLALFQSLCSPYLIANAHEVSAREFFQARKGMMRSYSQTCLAPQGNIAVMKALARVIQAKNGDVWTKCAAKKIAVTDGVARGVILDGEKGEFEITAKAVISNAGPKNTVALAGRDNFDKGYLREVASIKSGFQMWITTVSNRPLYDWPNLAVIQTRRMQSFLTPSLVCPELAPPGKHLHYSISGPDSQIGPWNVKEEVDLHVQDLMDNIPGFCKYGEILHVGCYHGDLPVLRNMPFVGYAPLSQKTPVENLYNVGDGVGPRGWPGGGPGCAMTARIVVGDIEKRFKPEGV
jgi:phytoene desaturase